jgi:hypothetical protein
MLNKDKLNKLYTLATGNAPAIQQTQKEKIKSNKKSLEKSKYNLAKMKGLYSDPLEAWQKWYRNERENIPIDSADDFWNEAETQFPGSPDQAKDWLRGEVGSLVDHDDPAIRDINMRNVVSKAPTWLSREMLPDLASTSAQVSNQNLTKTKMVYKQAFVERMKKFNLDDLDPEVPVDVHVEDVLKLEAFGLLDAASIMNGRFAISNNGTIQPAFALDSSVTGIEPGPEFGIIQEAVTPMLTQEISTALSNTSGIIEMDNSASRAATRRMLEDGSMDMSEWENAIRIVGNPDEVIDSGIRGMVAKNPNMDINEIISSAVDIGNIRKGFQ